MMLREDSVKDLLSRSIGTYIYNNDAFALVETPAGNTCTVVIPVLGLHSWGAENRDETGKPDRVMG